jgi:hypothetical protein
MEVKIDTKDHFRIFRVKNSALYANMAEDLTNCLLENKENPLKNAIVVLEEVQTIDDSVGEVFTHIGQVYQDRDLSFVITGDRKVIKTLEERGIACTPTLQEAIDFVMMEDLERELLGPENAENE